MFLVVLQELKELRAISNIVQELEKLQNKVDTIDKLLTDNTRLRKDIVAASNNYQTFMEDFQTFKNNVWYLIGIFVVVISVLLLFLNKICSSCVG